MPVTPSYPGIYIEELPSNTHTITAAPTSITVFVGYTHPFKTKPTNFNIVNNKPNPKAVEIHSFTDYEREFGGFFTSKAFDNDPSIASVANAVNQFFLNGGSDAYVIGLKAQNVSAATVTVPTSTTPSPAPAPTPSPPSTPSIGIVFKALEPIDTIQMKVSVEPRTPSQTSQYNTADITIIYGSRVETYRQVTLDPNDKQNYIENRIGTVSKQISSLVTVNPSPSTDYGKWFVQVKNLPLIGSTSTNGTVFNTQDFSTIFQANSELDKLPIFNLLVLPGVNVSTVNNITGAGILSDALAFCERKQAFLIMDPPPNHIADGQNPDSIYDDMENSVPKSTNGALYFPYIKSIDPVTGQSSVIDPTTGLPILDSNGLPIPFTLPPSGTVAGIFARTDLNRGVWKAPAGLETTILNTIGVVDSGRMTDPQQGVLNRVAINCLRTFPGIGTVVYGARTLVGYDDPIETPYQQWKYVPVRRMALFIEQTLYRNLGWVVFEPNDEPLWAAIRLSIGNFMLSLFRQGALQGSTPSQAFQVKCDSSTTTPDDQNNGIVNIVVAFAPLKPAEFVIVKIAQLAGQLQS